MYVVAITRWARPVEQEAAALAALEDMAAYDMKLRISGPLPVVFAREPDAERARRLLGALRARGHGAIACDLAQVRSSDLMTTPRSYLFEEEAFAATDRGGATRLMPYAEILALLRATAAVTAQSTTVDKSKKFSVGRAVMTGGLMMRKSSDKETRRTVEEHEQVLYLIRNNGRDPMILRERHLRHQGLGARAQATSLENFVTLVEMLRARAVGALYDERLLTQRRKSSIMSLAGTAAHSVTTSSNASENDLAAHLIAVAHLKGQL